MLSNLLLRDYIQFYNISSKGIIIDVQQTTERQFDLDDMQSPFCLKPFGDGALSFINNNEKLEIVNYENFVEQCKKPISFWEGRKRCDYVMCSTNVIEKEHSHVILAELTSTLGTIDNLRKPIHNKRGEVIFEGGKYEKAEIQLADSLSTLMAVPKIKKLFESMRSKQCILAYKVTPYKNPVKRMLHPMQRYLSIEAAETRENGAILANKTINDNGFTFRRINHEVPYRL